MKKLLRMTTIVLALLILFSSVPYSAFAAENMIESVGDYDTEIWDGSIANSFGGGNGSSSNPYLITNGSQLALLAKNVNAGSTYSSSTYFKLNNDIVLNYYDDYEEWNRYNAPANVFTPIGDRDHEFKGNIDGNGFTIYGLYSIKGGLIGEHWYGSIKNLNIFSSYIYGSNSYTAAFVDVAYSITIDNCCNKANVEGNSKAAGICGDFNGYRITNSYNYGTIKGTSYVGGVFSESWSSTYEKLINYGTIIGSSYYVGGIGGYLNTSTGGDCTLKKCINYGSVKGYSNVGGMLGEAYVDSFNRNININCNLNYGDVSGSSNVGGIVGQLANRGYMYLSQCMNYGSVTGTSSNIGGVVGYANIIAYNSISITNVANTGNVSGRDYVGGIVGYTKGDYYKTSISSSFNIGGVKKQDNCNSGGIVGYGSYNYVSNSYYIQNDSHNIKSGKELTIYQFAQQNNFSGFNFSSIWQMSIRKGYPELILTDMPADPSYRDYVIVDTEIDNYIIEQVKKYTSDNLDTNTQFNAIINANISGEVKLKLLNELFKNEGFTDAKEGIAYLRDTSTHRNDYKFLTTNNIFCAYNYYEWLYSDGYGTLARGMLYADGLIFNGELMSFLDVNTYTDKDYPGVKKNKKLLRDFLNDDIQSIKVINDAKTTASYFSKLIKLNNLTNEASLEEIMDKTLNAKTQNELEKYQKQFAELIARELKYNSSDKVYIEGEKFADALGYASSIISFAGASADNILQMMNLQAQIAKYEYYSDFLTEIASCRYASGEMRMAANCLLDEIKNGYWNHLVSLLGNVFTLEKGIISVKTNLWSELFGAGGAAAGQALGTLALASFISNIVVDTGDFVKQVAYTQGYAELSAIYSNKLQQDKIDFKANPTAENAWQFFRDYTMLWSLRYKGEEQYLNMNSVKMFLNGKVKTSNYTMKFDVVQDNLSFLDQKKFEFAEQYTVPANVMYSAKAVINCPVDVYVYTSDGTLIATLLDGIESDITNEYGRFAVMKQSYSREYTKIVASNGTDNLNIKTVAKSLGLIDYEYATVDEEGVITSYSINNIAIEKNCVMQTNLLSSTYTLDIDGNGETDVNGEMNPDLGGHIPVQTITADANNCVMKTGQQKLIKATVSPSNASVQTLDWFTDNEDVVSVKNGVITALDKGIAHVYAKAIDNEEVLFSMKVQVVRKDLLLGDVTLDEIIDIADATCIQMYLAEYMELGKDARKAADVNSDGMVNINDVTYIQLYLVELPDSSAVVGEVKNTYIDTQYTVFGDFDVNWDPGYETGYHMQCLTDYGEFGEYTYTFESLPAGHYHFGITDGTGILQTDMSTLTEGLPSGYYEYIGRNGEKNGQYMEFIIVDDANVTIKFDEKTKACTLSIDNTNDDYWWSTGDENLYHTENPFVSFGDCGEKTAYVIYPDGRMSIFGRGQMNDGCPYQDHILSISSVTINSGVTSVGASAFVNAVNLENAILPLGIEAIGERAFENTGIQQIIIPQTVNSIGKYVFNNCLQLTKIHVDDDDEQYFSVNDVLYNKKTLALVSYPANYSDTSYELLANSTAMEEGALNQSKNLQTLIIPQSVCKIDDNVFNGCDGLMTIDFLGPKHIWDRIDISENSGLPSNVTMQYHFYQREYKVIGNLSNPCKWNDNQEYSMNYVSNDGDYGVYDLVVESIPSGHYHFTIEYGNTSIPADFYLTKATNLRIQYDEDGDLITYETSVPNCAFAIAETEGEMMDTYSCGDNAYSTMYENGLLILSGCGDLWYVPMYSGVKRVVVLDGITDITSYAFYYGEQLEEVYLSSTVSGVVSQCFYECTNLNRIIVDTDNRALCVEDGVLFNKTKTSLICYPAKKSNTAYSIPEGVTSVGEGAFCGCESLTEITLPDSVTDFSAISIRRCNALAAVKVKESNTKFIQESGVLYDAKKETLILYPAGKQDQTFELPNTVQTISSYSFKSNTLGNIVIPNSVTTIEGYAFTECTDLTEINYLGTEEEWTAISKNENLNYIFSRITINYLSQDEESIPE